MHKEKHKKKLVNRQIPPVVGKNLTRDTGMYEWLNEQSWSEFAVSLINFYDEHGGFTENQYNAAFNMRLKLDEFYDPYGNSVKNGVYINDDNGYLYKLSWVTKNDYKSRSLRKRHIESPAWRDVKNTFSTKHRIEFFQKVKNGELRLLGENELMEIGRKTSICCVCAMPLDNPKSIALGIGPHCLRQQRLEAE